MNYAKIILGGMVALGATAFSMPTPEQTKKVEQLVVELMRDDQAALKSGKKTRVEVAESAMALADQAESEAAKLLLMKGAYNLYVRDGEFDKAIETLQSLQKAIPDMPPANMASIIESSLRSVPRKNGGQLYRLLDETKTRVRYANEAASLEKSVKKAPADRTFRLKLAEHYAYLGKWDLALENFAASGGKVSVIAKSERDGDGVTEKIADFWWDYPNGKAEELVKGFRSHAAKLYEDAIAAGAIKGLNKVQAERRINEAKEFGECVMEVAESASKPSPTTQFKTGVKPGTMTVLKVADDCDIEFAYCPAGSFKMGYEGVEKIAPLRDITISRPFWMSKRKITKRQFLRVGVPTQDKDIPADVNNPAKSIERFSRLMNEKYGKLLPAGYVFRVATEAEYEYVSKAEAKKGDPRLLWGFVQENVNNPWGVEDLFSPSKLVFQDLAPFIGSKGLAPWCNASNKPVPRRVGMIDYSKQPPKDPLMWCKNQGTIHLRREIVKNVTWKLTANKDGGLSGSVFYLVAAPSVDSLNKFILQ